MPSGRRRRTGIVPIPSTASLVLSEMEMVPDVGRISMKSDSDSWPDMCQVAPESKVHVDEVARSWGVTLTAKAWMSSASVRWMVSAVAERPSVIERDVAVAMKATASAEASSSSSSSSTSELAAA